MAKSRKTSRKTPRRAGARKMTGRRRSRARSPKKIELRPVRRQMEAHIKSLRAAEQTVKVRSALRRLRRCLAEIRRICGPDMSIPLS